MTRRWLLCKMLAFNTNIRMFRVHTVSDDIESIVQRLAPLANGDWSNCTVLTKGTDVNSWPDLQDILESSGWNNFLAPTDLTIHKHVFTGSYYTFDSATGLFVLSMPL